MQVRTGFISVYNNPSLSSREHTQALVEKPVFYHLTNVRLLSLYTLRQLQYHFSCIKTVNCTSLCYKTWLNCTNIQLQLLHFLTNYKIDSIDSWNMEACFRILDTQLTVNFYILPSDVF